MKLFRYSSSTTSTKFTVWLQYHRWKINLRATLSKPSDVYINYWLTSMNFSLLVKIFNDFCWRGLATEKSNESSYLPVELSFSESLVEKIANDCDTNHRRARSDSKATAPSGYLRTRFTAALILTPLRCTFMRTNATWCLNTDFVVVRWKFGYRIRHWCLTWCCYLRVICRCGQFTIRTKMMAKLPVLLSIDTGTVSEAVTCNMVGMFDCPFVLLVHPYDVAAIFCSLLMVIGNWQPNTPIISVCLFETLYHVCHFVRLFNIEGLTLSLFTLFLEIPVSHRGKHFEI